MGDRELGASDIAKRHGVTRETASRWLAALEKKYGAKVVGRHGNRRYTTEQAFARVAPLAAAAKDDRRIAELEARVTELERRLDLLARSRR